MHLGSNIKRIRELKGIKIEVFAAQLGVPVKAVEKIENYKNVGKQTVDKIASVLDITPEDIRNFDESMVKLNGAVAYQTPVDSSPNLYINPVEKMVLLYERLLESEREKNALLKEMLDKMTILLEKSK